MKLSLKQWRWSTALLGGLVLIELAAVTLFTTPGRRTVERWQLGAAGLVPLAFFISAGLLERRRWQGQSGASAIIARSFFWFWGAGMALIFGVFYTKMVFRWW